MATQIPQEVKIGLPPAAEISGAITALTYARTIVVNDQSSYELAAHELQQIKQRAERIEAARVALKAPVLAAGRAIDAFFNEALEPLGEAEIVVKATMLSYSQEQQRIADAARRKQEEEARAARVEAERQARAAREKAEAESRRQQEVARQAQLEADRAAEAVRAAREAGDRQKAAELEKERKTAEEAQRKAQAASERATENGERKAAEAMNTAAEVAARPVMVAEAPTAKGVSVRSTWSAKVVDLKKLVASVAEGKTPLAALTPDMKVLNAAATALKSELGQFYPGVESAESIGLAASKRGS